MSDESPTCRTLVVEDDDASRMALAALLKGMGVQTETASTLAEAINKLVDWRPECVLLDLMLPDGRGEFILEVIRRAGWRTRVGVVSGVSDPQRAANLQALRPDRFFRKPISISDITKWMSATMVKA